MEKSSQNYDIICANGTTRLCVQSRDYIAYYESNLREVFSWQKEREALRPAEKKK